MSANRIELIGNLTHDPQLRKTRKSNRDVCNFSLATDDGWVDEQGNKVEKTSYHQVAVYGAAGRAVFNNLKKGDECRVIGKLTYNQVERTDIKLTDGSTFRLPSPTKVTYTQVQATEPVHFLRKAARNQKPVDAGQELAKPPQVKQEEREMWEQWAEEKAIREAAELQAQPTE